MGPVAGHNVIQHDRLRRKIKRNIVADIAVTFDFHGPLITDINDIRVTDTDIIVGCIRMMLGAQTILHYMCSIPDMTYPVAKILSLVDD
jgi:hypothetical protein